MIKLKSILNVFEYIQYRGPDMTKIFYIK